MNAMKATVEHHEHGLHEAAENEGEHRRGRWIRGETHGHASKGGIASANAARAQSNAELPSGDRASGHEKGRPKAAFKLSMAARARQASDQKK